MSFTFFSFHSHSCFSLLLLLYLRVGTPRRPGKRETMAAPAAADAQLEFKTYTYSSTGAVYEGTFKGTKRHGKGHWRHPNGEIFEGEYSENKQNGKGVYVFGKTGKQYIGYWATGQMHGVGCYYFAADKSTFYLGQYAEDKKHGSGFYVYDNGVMTVQSWNAGELVNEVEALPVDRIECAKQLYDLVQDVRSVAPKELGEMPPKLETKSFQFPSGATYCGQFFGTKKHGQGNWTHPDGDSYEGHFEDNKHTGWGVYISGRSGKKYAGQWTDGKMHGWGVYFFNPQETEYYCGQYKDDKKDGTGIYHFAESGQTKLQVWSLGELVNETDADEETVMAYVAAIKKLVAIVQPAAPRYHSKAFSSS